MTNKIIDNAVEKGLKLLATAMPIKLAEWMEEHFYLSAESSYVEQKWRPYPYQMAIANCISNDEIEEFIWVKPARVGYTKIILAAIGYFAQHKHRNQAIWQPTDSDALDFCKSEVNTMLRDVPVMQEIFPMYKQRHKDNTLNKKTFLGSILNILGGKAAKNYRRITIDIGFGDELDAFDMDVESEGSPPLLIGKRLEGATFPKLILGSTPKIKNYSMIESKADNTDEVFNYHVPCPNCKKEHVLDWGEKAREKLPDKGFIWTDNDPETVAHLCPHCDVFYTQDEYFTVWEQGRWISKNGIWMTNEGEFKTLKGKLVPTPRAVAIQGFWSAYSPQLSWASIVRDYISAKKRKDAGDDSELKTFENTTLARSYEVKTEKADEHELMNRAEPYPLRVVPMGGLMLFAGVDTQDDRWEVTVWAFGRGEEMWIVDYAVVYGDPANERDWDNLDNYLKTVFPHKCGAELPIEAVGVDTGGHFTHQVYSFCRTRTKRRIYALHGAHDKKTPIKGRASLQDVNYKGKIIKRGVRLWKVGVHNAKNLLFGRLKVKKPGPGMVHFSKDLPLEFYMSLTAEHRIPIKTSHGEEERWVKIRPRNDVLDCTNYSIFASHMRGLHMFTDTMWDRLEKKVQGVISKVYKLDKNKKLKGKEKKKAKDIKEKEEPEEVEDQEEAQAKKKKKRRRNRNFVNSW